MAARLHKKTHPNYKKRIAVVLLAVLSIGLLAYPFIRNTIATHQQAQVIDGYNQAAGQLSEAQIQQELEAAQKYNALLAQGTVPPSGGTSTIPAYNDLLNPQKDGVMGSLTIPKINISLPIYHGTSETVLQKGAGHMEGTSLLVGGASTHAVLTGHSGLPSAELFTNLDKLVVGDTFTIHILNKTLQYKVDQIRTVLPDDTSDIQIEDGKDYVTLLTCTPYGINDHRLLVRGIRTSDAVPEQAADADANQIKLSFAETVLLCVMFLAVFAGYFISLRMLRDDQP